MKARESNLCGYLGGITLCEGKMIWEQNPLPDGDLKLPRHLSFGPSENPVDVSYNWTMVIVGSFLGAISGFTLVVLLVRYHQLGNKTYSQCVEKRDRKITITMAEANKIDGKYIGCGPECTKHHKSKPICLVSSLKYIYSHCCLQ